ncbi:MAG TPA: phage tail sheath C-terminal domain-containing protein [Blastococcus sp.]|nr:phage tail sheath C-terminal domain-containing protein [Blastococcus sp.]
MPALTYPGVYIQETSGGVRPLEIASTSTAAFVGLSEMGPDVAQRLTSWAEFQRHFGGFFVDGYLAQSVFQFFNNGGRQCYVVRIVRSDAVAATVTLQNRADPAVAGLTVTARSKGAWGNFLLLQIEDGTLDPANEFRLSIRRQTDAATVPAGVNDLEPVEVFDNLSMDTTAPNFVGGVLATQSTLIDATVPGANTSTRNGVHRGGFGPRLPLGNKALLQINIDDDGVREITLPPAATAATDLDEVASAVQTAVRALTKLKNSTDATAYSAFACTAEQVDGKTRLALASGTAGVGSSVVVRTGGPTDASGQLGLGVANGGRSENGIAVRRPVTAAVVQLGDAVKEPPVTAAAPGVDGKADLTEASFTTAFARLDRLTDFSLLAVPGEVAVPGDENRKMIDLGMEYCANRPLQDVFFIGEMASHDDTVDDAQTFRNKLNTANSYGALYFPWVTGSDPTGRSRTPVSLPPSGYIAGMYARTDATRGVWKAPAGVAASLNGISGLTVELDDVEHGVLNPAGIDVIRRFPGAGVVAFGARTISSDPAWKYIPVRRTAIMLRVSIYYGIQWAVFEPNDEALWSQLRLTIGSFMTTLFRQGAFQGSSATDAFFVKCDADTTTQADIDLGVVNVLVGFAALKPAEFVVVKISQLAGQATG